MGSSLKNINWREISKVKLFFYSLLALLCLTIVLSIVKTTLTVRSGGSLSNVPRMASEVSYDSAAGYPNTSVDALGDYEIEESLNVTSKSTSQSAVSGAEDYEAVSYSAKIKNKEIENICDTIESWKPLGYVVFESTARNDNHCSYSFKVERLQAEAIAEEVKTLDPYDFTANIQTQKRQVLYYEGRLDILLQQQEMYKEYIANINEEYDRAIASAVDAQNSNALATLLRNRQEIVEQIDNQRISLANQLQNLAQSSGDVEDSIDYVSFSVVVYKYQIFNFQGIKDSWVSALGNLVNNINSTLQDLTVGVLNLFLGIFLVFVYGAIIIFTVVFAARLAAEIVKGVWKRTEIDDRQHEYHES